MTALVGVPDSQYYVRDRDCSQMTSTVGGSGFMLKLTKAGVGRRGEGETNLLRLTFTIFLVISSVWKSFRVAIFRFSLHCTRRLKFIMDRLITKISHDISVWGVSFQTMTPTQGGSKQSWPDLKKRLTSFVNNPLSISGSFVKNKLFPSTIFLNE